MSFFDQISKSLSYHGKAFGFIIANKFAWTLFVPIVVFIVLLGFGIFAVGSYFADMLVDMAGELLEESPFLITIFSTFIIIVIRILLFIIFGLWGGYVVVVIMSPFLAYVSEKTETILSGREYKFDFPQFIHDIFRGIALAVRNMFMEFLISIVIFFLPVIPIIGALTSVTVGTVFLFFVSAYFYGFSFIDYTLERRRLTVGQSVTLMRRRKGTACGHGLVFALILFIPIVGAFISAVYAIISTVASTMEFVDEQEAMAPTQGALES